MYIPLRRTLGPAVSASSLGRYLRWCQALGRRRLPREGAVHRLRVPSVALAGALNGAHEVVEQRAGVVGARRRLRVVLYSEDWQALMAQTFDRAVVQVHV